MTEQTKSGIKRAIDIAGSTRKLADLLGVTQAAVWQWSDNGYAPVERVLEIETHTGVPRKDLIKPQLASLLEQ